MTEEETSQKVFHIPTTNLAMRWLVLLVGIFVFVWMGLEDDTTWRMVLVSAVVWFTGISWILTKRFGGKKLSTKWFMFACISIGVMSGVGISLTTALMMIFKNARHNHPFPDYPTELILEIVRLAPFWSLVGGLFAIGISLLWLALQQK